MVEQIRDKDGALLALLINSRSLTPETGLHFFTEESTQLQVARMVHPEGHVIPLHRHRLVHREVIGTPEVLFIKRGMVRATIGSNIRTLNDGDVLLLLSGMHGLEFLTDAEVWEIKQGPYRGKDDDKIVEYRYGERLDHGGPARLWSDGPEY